MWKLLVRADLGTSKKVGLEHHAEVSKSSLQEGGCRTLRAPFVQVPRQFGTSVARNAPWEPRHPADSSFELVPRPSEG